MEPEKTVYTSHFYCRQFSPLVFSACHLYIQTDPKTNKSKPKSQRKTSKHTHTCHKSSRNTNRLDQKPSSQVKKKKKTLKQHSHIKNHNLNPPETASQHTQSHQIVEIAPKQNEIKKKTQIKTLEAAKNRNQRENHLKFRDGSPDLVPLG